MMIYNDRHASHLAIMLYSQPFHIEINFKQNGQGKRKDRQQILELGLQLN